MKKRVESLTIIDKQELRSNYIYWELQSEDKFDKIIPGQFINILVEDTSSTFLRRPFSIHDINLKKNAIQVLMKVVGKGTEALAMKNIGDRFNTVFPLGNGFSIIENEDVLLIGGGYGIAPLYHLAKELILFGSRPIFLLGARTENDFILLEKFKKLAPLNITTEDGSKGKKGRVTDHRLLFKKELKFSKIYSCGPEPMMKAVGKFAKEKNIDCEVSLDQMMGCGIGVCLSCVAKTVRGNETSCIHGPIFNTKDLIW